MDVFLNDLVEVSQVFPEYQIVVYNDLNDCKSLLYKTMKKLKKQLIWYTSRTTSLLLRLWEAYLDTGTSANIVRVYITIQKRTSVLQSVTTVEKSDHAL